ncbi:MAG TPA: DUF4359 domain-containing protein [Nitrospiraceae bacterium]|nr:DUF4359 domain-containing protein [Nitrospiraceae bacterium]
MSNIKLAILAGLLGICVVLAVTNPTSQDYGAFLQTQLGLVVARMDQSLSGQERALMQNLYATQGTKLIELVLQKYTQRRNFGLFCLFESRVLEQKVIVVGVATRFIPVEGVEEATVKLGQLVTTLKR